VKRFLGKFTVGNLVLRPQTGVIGVVEESGDFNILSIRWQTGIQHIRLNPGNAKEYKILERVKKLQVLTSTDFNFFLSGMPSRIRRLVKGEGVIQLRIDSVGLGKLPSVEDLTESVYEHFADDLKATHVTVKTKRKHQLIEIFAEFLVNTVNSN
jgi:hypothetical protein